MKQLIILVTLVLMTTSTFSQQKELTLSDAVTQQYRAFYPKSLSMFSWVPMTDSYTYLDGYTALMKASVRNSKASELLNIKTFNERMNSKMYWFSGFEWKNKNEFWVNDGFSFFSYNVVEQEGRLLYKLDEGVENTTFHNGTEHVAFTKENNIHISTGAGLTINVTDNTNKNIVSGQAIARSEFGITGGLFWSPDGESLAFYQKDETDVHDYPLLDNSVTPGALELIKYPMTGQPSEKPSVGIYNIKSRSTSFIQPREGVENYLTNVSWTKDNRYVVVAEVNRGQNHMWLNVYDASNGMFIRTLFEEKNDKWIEPEHPAYFLDGKSNEFIWISERDGYNNLYHYNFEGELIKQLTTNEFVLKDIVDYKNGKIFFTATGVSPLDTKFFNVTLSGRQSEITRLAGTHKVSISSNGKYFHDHYSSHEVPSKDLILTGSGKTLKTLMESPNMLSETELGGAEVGSITANDGTKLYTRLIKPSNFDPSEKYPVLVYVYGGPHAQLITNSWLDGASLWMYWMAEQGYLVYTVDNRGSGERGFAFESQIHRQLGKVEMEDQLSGVAYLKSLPYVDADRLAVHGWSFGGFMATSLMLRQPGVFQVAVAGGPVTDWKYYEAMYGERYMDMPEENLEGYEEASLLTHAANLEGDLLLIHGTIDNVVVMQHNLALVQRFVELGVQMDFFPYPMHEHNVRGKDRVHLMTKVLEYVIENNQ
ncbi:MAG: DPP IV N-terminal domain-containing protein [Crocinitomicaceae bacterium]|nr:DPP IV N-terminal domain-containing protein [Crocinitomicaceae bacterium]MDG1776015.1 DPP IV N-terminal domain-containing protein [Crocinitomicaceae bacterium]